MQIWQFMYEFLESGLQYLWQLDTHDRVIRLGWNINFLKAVLKEFTCKQHLQFWKEEIKLLSFPVIQFTFLWAHLMFLFFSFFAFVYNAKSFTISILVFFFYFSFSFSSSFLNELPKLFSGTFCHSLLRKCVVKIGLFSLDTLNLSVKIVP